MVATKHNQSCVLRHTTLANLLSRVLKAHTSDFVSHSSDHRALFTLFQLQFGAMSPNRAIKLECVSSIVWDKASVEDVHYESLVVFVPMLDWNQSCNPSPMRGYTTALPTQKMEHVSTSRHRGSGKMIVCFY